MQSPKMILTKNFVYWEKIVIMTSEKKCKQQIKTTVELQLLNLNGKQWKLKDKHVQ